MDILYIEIKVLHMKYKPPRFDLIFWLIFFFQAFAMYAYQNQQVFHVTLHQLGSFLTT